MVPIVQWDGQQGSETLGPGSNPSIYLKIYFTLFLRFRIVRNVSCLLLSKLIFAAGF